MADNFWAVIADQLGELESATSADDVIRILSHERNPYRLLPHATEPTDTGDGFFAGSGGDDTVWSALRTAGWSQVWAEWASHYAMRAPDDSVITYIEGDIYRSDRRPATQEG